jgi:hypothetical protein
MTQKCNSLLGRAIILGLLLFSGLVSAQNKSKKAERIAVVGYSTFFSSMAADQNACSVITWDADDLRLCSKEPLYRSQLLDKKAEEDELDFEASFATAFRSESMCSGLTLAFTTSLGQKDYMLTKAGCSRDGTHCRSEDMLQKYWSLVVFFVPNQEKQPWRIFRVGPSVTLDDLTDGKGDARSMAHTVCSIVKGIGGSVVE